ncbi:SAM-dependent methyltransferase [Saccharothrix tamanrassetensis]|uniref:SAM-dependent methyltransferase n=1 Tax=Saccharothrix tamanrassetensis TaxID=1051531 RepID=A0A841CEW3_9PSEU|nr:class I SAM-dependent methyltransferase [Saccharothrix tamanrassetensis]MBB5955493.1 SAM-dependent methyltransferase [Saccharothrix tamanrassetensis]
MSDFSAVRVDPSNSGQLDTWNGDQGAFWADHAERFEDGVARYHPGFLDAAAIGPAEDVLDVGCGSGRTTRDAARRGASALGVDLSARMIDLARRLAEREGVRNASFEQADAQVHPFPEAGFDLAVSRHGSMFFGDPVAAFGNVGRALRPGGRLVLLTWQPLAANEFMTAFRTALAAGRELPVPPPDAPSPFSLSDPERVRHLLTSAGFTDVRLRGVNEQMYFGRDVEDAFVFTSHRYRDLVRELDDDTRARAFDDLRTSLAAHETPEGVWYDSAAWIVTARRP